MPEELGTMDHIEPRNEKTTPLPFTGTSYRSHFISAEGDR